VLPLVRDAVFLWYGSHGSGRIGVHHTGVSAPVVPTERLRTGTGLSTLTFVTALLGAACALLVVGYSASGGTVGFAWPIILRVLLVATPLAVGVHEVGLLLGKLLPRTSYQQAAFIAAGVTMITILPPGRLPLLPMVGLIAVLLVRLLTLPPLSRRSLGLSALAIAFLLLSVSLMNNVVLRLAGDRLIDPQLRWTDEVFYSHVLGITSYVGIFPLTKALPVFAFFENSYLSLAFLPMLVPMVLADQPRRIALFLATAVLCYALAGLIFLALPAVGPTVYFPDALDPRFKQTVTAAAIELMRAEATAIRSGLSPTTGLGYFIALPSLHAAMATVCQYHLRTSRPHFWMMLPVTVLLVLSTFLLGQHYIVDAVAGVLLGSSVSVAVAHAADRFPPGSRWRSQPDTGLGSVRGAS
jgi:PAP2 superfamily